MGYEPPPWMQGIGRPVGGPRPRRVDSEGRANMPTDKNRRKRLDNRLAESKRRGGAMVAGIDHTKIRKTKKGNYYVYNYQNGRQVGKPRKATEAEIRAYKTKGTGSGGGGNGDGTTTRTTRRSGGSGSGGSGSSGSSSSSTSTGSSAQKSSYSKPVEQVKIDWEKMYAPARKQIDNMRAEVARRRKVDEDNWTAYKTWAEGMATKTAAALKANNDATNAAVKATNTSAMESINKHVEQARAAMGESGSLGAATGAASMSADAAASAAQGATEGALIGDAQKSYDALATAANSMDQYNVAMAKATYDNAHNQALYGIDTKSTEIDQAIAAAKLDKFYKDRQYNLDLEAAEWLRGYRDRSLDASIAQADRTADIQEAANDARAADTAQRASDSAEQQVERAAKMIREKMSSANYNEADGQSSGEFMKDMAADIVATYPNMSGVAIIQAMQAAFRTRLSGHVNALQDLDEFLKRMGRGSPGIKYWQKINPDFVPR